MKLTEKIGKKIREIRVEKSVTQEELGFRTEIQQSLIYRLENGKRRINADHLEKISQALGVPVIIFFEERIDARADIDDQQLLGIISQMKASKRETLLGFIQLLQNSADDIDLEILKKAVEIIELVKKD